ncbi:hypothetical protein BH20ACT2_BH20ACT2_13450 [soil metagenome]
MEVLAWVIVGLIAGGLARIATGSRKRGCLGTVLIGILGGLIGGFLFKAAGQRGATDFDLWSILVAFVGASVLLLVLDGGRRR